MNSLMHTIQIVLLASIVLAEPRLPRLTNVSPSSSGLLLPLASTTVLKEGCPRQEDIHPCKCVEIPMSVSDASGEEGLETMAFCQNIRHIEVLQDAMKGMQGHIIHYMVMDSCNLPPFPNGLFFNVGIKWMEILNSTVQFGHKFLECATNCW